MKIPEWMRESLVKNVPVLHRRLWRITRGRLGWRFGELEFCLLTTIGHHSGREHTTPLVLIRDTSRLALVASNGGSNRQPDWFLNLVENPRITLETKNAREEKIARVATDSEREVLWPITQRVYAGYGAYQHKTNRVIPIVILEEDSSSSVE